MLFTSLAASEIVVYLPLTAHFQCQSRLEEQKFGIVVVSTRLYEVLLITESSVSIFVHMSEYPPELHKYPRFERVGGFFTI